MREISRDLFQALMIAMILGALAWCAGEAMAHNTNPHAAVWWGP